MGNPTSVVDVKVATEECLAYDHWNRLTRAYTVASAQTCTPLASTVPATDAMRGTQPYDDTYTYSDIDQLESVKDSLPVTDVTATYTYPASSYTTPPARPHAVTQVANGTTTKAYTYNANGSMLNRAGQVLTWDAANRLVATSGTGAQSNVYGVNNQRLVRVDTATGNATLYLPGIEVTGSSTAAGAVTKTTYYSIGGANIAIRTATGLLWTCPQRQGSTTCTTPAAPTTGPTPTRRRLKPYGNERTGTAVSVTGTDHGFLGQPEDNTGLNYLNNRYQDPSTGVFISVDPLVGSTGRPYDYANNNPITGSDPSGLVCKTTGDCQGTSTTVVPGKSPVELQGPPLPPAPAPPPTPPARKFSSMVDVLNLIGMAGSYELRNRLYSNGRWHQVDQWTVFTYSAGRTSGVFDPRSELETFADEMIGSVSFPPKSPVGVGAKPGEPSVTVTYFSEVVAIMNRSGEANNEEVSGTPIVVTGSGYLIEYRRKGGLGINVNMRGPGQRRLHE